MWKCIGILFFLGQSIIVTSESAEEEILRYARKTGECCSCEESTSRRSDADHGASENVAVMSCPCLTRNADSETAASIFSPTLSALQPFARQVEKNGELKPLLEPEVDLASSVLETLREATEEEYKEALARDAARSAIQSSQVDGLVNDVVTLFDSRDAQENIDPLPESSNNQERRCVYPQSDDFSSTNLFGRGSGAGLPNRDYLHRTFDMNYAPSDVYNSFNLPNQLRDQLGLRSPHDLLRNPSSSGLRSHYLPTNINPLVRRPFLLPALHTRPLYNTQRPLDLSNLMNLRDVELIPPRKVTIMKQPNIQTESESDYYKMVHPIFEPNTESSYNIPTKSVTPHSAGIDVDADCSSNDKENNYIHTKILNSIPTSLHSTIEQSNLLHQSGNNIQHADIIEKSLEHDGTPAECFDQNSLNINTISQNSLRNNDPSTGESRSRDMFSSPKYSDNIQYFKANAHSAEHEDGTKLIQEGTSSVKGNVLKTLEEFKQANAMMHEHLRSSLDDVLKLDAGEKLVDEERTSSRSALVSGKHFKEQNSNEPKKSSILSGDKSNEYRQLSLVKSVVPPSVYNKENNEKKEKSAINVDFDQNDDLKNKLYTNQNLKDHTDLARDSQNYVTCMVHDSSKLNHQNLINEMKTAASEPIKNTRFRFNQHSSSIPKINHAFNNPIPENPLEDINLDIFQYQPVLQGIEGVKNLPRFNMKSYKTQLPIPNSLDLKPVKLQKAIRKGNDILGATLTMKPHSSNSINNKMRSSQNQPSGLGIPNIEDIRSLLETNTHNVFNLPFLGNTNGNLRSFAEGAFKNVQDTLDNTFKEIDTYPQITDTVFNPTDIIESIAEVRDNANDRLRAIQVDLNDRLKKFHQNLISQSRNPSLLLPQLHERAPYYEHNTDFNIRNKKNNQNRPCTSNIGESKQAPLRPSLNKDILNSRASSLKQKPVIASTKIPLSRSQSRTATLDRDTPRLSQKLDSKRPLPLHERLKLARENKGIISLTTKKPPIIEYVPKTNTLSSQRPITIPKKETQTPQSRTLLSDPSIPKRKQISMEPKSSPSELAYSNIPAIDRTSMISSCPENIIDGTETLGGLSENRNANPTITTNARNSYKKSILPNIAENTFLSKVKEAVMSSDLTQSLLLNRNNVHTNTDVIPSASEPRNQSSQPSDGISFNCKMMCSKS